MYRVFFIGNNHETSAIPWPPGEFPKVIRKTPFRTLCKARFSMPPASHHLHPYPANQASLLRSRLVSHLRRGLIDSALLYRFRTLDNLLVRLYELTAMTAPSSAEVPASVSLDVETPTEASSVSTLKEAAQAAETEPAPAHTLFVCCEHCCQVGGRKGDIRFHCKTTVNRLRVVTGFAHT